MKKDIFSVALIPSSFPLIQKVLALDEMISVEDKSVRKLLFISNSDFKSSLTEKGKLIRLLIIYKVEINYL